MKVYLDNNATTPLHPEVQKEIIQHMSFYGNPNSMHEFGRIVHQKLFEARQNIASFFNAAMDDLIITSCGSESNNTVLKQLLFNTYNFTPHLITSKIEHPAIIETAKFLQKKGVDVTFLPVNSNGILDLDQLRNAIKKETVLISIMYANNEIGTIQNIDAIGSIAHENGIFFHTDAVQASGKIKFSLRDMPVDFASFSAHKLYAPKGMGILYIKNFNKAKTKLIPLIHGGHQEHGFRAGTENTLGIIAFGKICQIMFPQIDEVINYVKSLRDYFENEIVRRIPDIKINAKNANRLPGTSNISFRFIEGESILLRLDLHGIAVSTGSACSTGSLEPSHVLMALYNDPEMAHGSIRFSFGRENTREEVDYVLGVLEKEIAFLRSISPITK